MTSSEEACPGGGGKDVESFIKRLHSGSKSAGKVNVPMNENEVRVTLIRAQQVFKEQPMFLKLEVPTVICGDIHGQFNDLNRIFRHVGFPPTSNYLFLGDYVDRGSNSLETIMLLLLYKIRNPQTFFLLRGNHETEDISRVYGFLDEMTRRFPPGVGPRLWKEFQDVFAVMPVAALVGEKILCMHGGIPKDLNLEKGDWSQIDTTPRPCEVGHFGIVCDLLWSDPGRAKGFVPNTRGVSWLYGPDVMKQFCDAKGIDLICRAHQVIEDGYEFTKDSAGDTRLVTIFSAPNYCGEFNNKGAILKVSDKLRCSFYVIKPCKERKKKRLTTNLSSREVTTCERLSL